ncbi:MAG TPA: DHA2 family efflux MFS transporter permease subunit [Trueperaceae bacterium]|nr:DHA2 family efflux MFS transporter permease subunit [Trueperaceae bacterium]
MSRRDWQTIIVLLVAAFVVILNETIMNVALPSLMVELDVSANTVQWLSTAFLLTMAVVIPMTGFLLQRFTTRFVFVLAMSLFSLGTLVAGLAPGFVLLLAGRVVQAAGTAIMMPLLMTTILRLVPTHSRGSVLGTVSIVISVAPALGPTVSGIILQLLSWRFMFLLVLPIALVAIVIGVRLLERGGEVRRSSIDVLSVLLAAVGFGGFVYGVSVAGEAPGAFGRPEVLAPIVVGGLSLIVFVARQLRLQRSDNPLLDLRVFRFPMFSLSVGLFMIAMLALFGSMILLPIYLQSVRGFDTLQTGLFLLPGGALMGLAAPFVGRLFDRVGPVPMTTIGASLIALMLWRFSTIGADTSVPLLLALHLLLSSGMALLFTPLMTTGMNPLPPRLYSHGSAVMSTLQQVGGAMGVALLVTVMTSRAGSFGASVAPELAMAAGLRTAFAVGAGFAVLAAVLTVFLRRVEPEEGEAKAEAGAPIEVDELAIPVP